MDSRDKEKILQKVEKLLTDNLRYFEVLASYKEADGYNRVVRLPLFDETYTYPTNKEAVQDE
jgi:hypothetical protein